MATTAVAGGEPVGDDLALEGFSGFINVPTAWVHQQGRAHFLITNQEDPRFRAAARTRTYVFSAGFFPYVEAAMRITDVTSGLRDLSLNAKVQLPLDLIHPGLPFALAVGTQDEGGAAPHFRTRYVVGSAEWWRLRATAGYGTGPDRMRGLFGGLELRAFEWARLMVDYDGLEAHAGARLTVPVDVLDVPLRVGVLAKTSLSSQPGRMEWAGTLSAPLSLRADARIAERGPKVIRLPERTGTPQEQLQADLLDVGFQNVRIGRAGRTLVVEYENNVFSHSEAEGLGVVLGLVAHRIGDDFDEVAAVMHRAGTRVAELEAPIGAIKAFYGLAPFGLPPPLQKAATVTVAPPERTADWQSQTQNSTFLKTQLILQPGLRHFVGTEASVYDATLSLRPEVIAPLWSGGAAYARWDIPFAWTPMLERGARLSSFRSGPRLDHALLTQSFTPTKNVLVLVGGGVYRVTSMGGLGEVLWTPGDGRHALGVQSAFTVEPDGTRHTSVVGGYRLFIDEVDAVASLKVGQFYENDRGAMLEVARYFGNVLVGVFAARTDNNVIGVTASLPLTPRAEMKPSWVQLRGARRWTTNVETLVGGGPNLIRSGVALTPAAPYSLESTFLDGARVNGASLIPLLPQGRRAFERQFGREE